MFSKKKTKKVREPVIVRGMGSKAREREEQMELRRTKGGKSCVLCVGSSGSGKTATIERRMGMEGLAGSLEAELEAAQFKIYHQSNEGGDQEVWVDSSGASWEDKHWEDALALQENLLQV